MGEHMGGKGGQLAPDWGEGAAGARTAAAAARISTGLRTGGGCGSYSWAEMKGRYDLTPAGASLARNVTVHQSYTCGLYRTKLADHQ